MAILDTVKNTFNNLPSQQTPAPFDMEAFKSQLAGGAKSTNVNTSTNQGAVNNAPIVVPEVKQKAPVVPQVQKKTPLALSGIDKARADLQKAQGMLNEMNQVSTGATSEANAISNRGDEIIPEVQDTTEPTSLKEQVQSQLEGKLAGSTSTADARADKAEQQNLAFLSERRNEKKNEITRKRIQHELDVERLEKNTGGRSRIANSGRKNKMIKDFNRQNVFDTLDFHMMNEDFQGASNAVDTYMRDLATDSANEMKTWQFAMDFANDDMTESEILEANQAHARNMAAESFQNQKDLATFKADLASVGGAGAPKVQSINGVDSIWNPVTGEFQPISMEAGGDAVTKAENQLNFLSTASKDLIKLAGDTGGFKTPIGPSGITRLAGDLLIGNTKFRQAENLAQSLKTNILTLQTDPAIKKFFGPQMSEADVRMMSAGGTTLDPQAQSPEQFIAEAKRVDDMLNRALTSVAQGQSATGGKTLTAPDGTVVEIID